ncbi:replication protein A 70 kDa DNA-binding subunit B-like [Lactuca sativa]|uniref:replication protein A 70 kDa DNA-binding subunit B-like n=1 Tax=Lactuca sativa TaxID=4236 RepID=UPI0022AF9CE8|nr:replication protein A 70 kDa DNA-binding subunit B-like [Lactuca sativa]
MSNVLDITPALKTEWTALIQVLEVGHIQENIGREELRHLLFTDCKGTKVLAIIYGYHLPLFKHTFKPYKRYYISNAVIIKVQTQFVISSYKYSWSLNNRTLVQPYPELKPPVLPCHFQFTPFTQLHRHAETDNYQNIRGVVIKCFPSEQLHDGSELSSKRDIIIVNEERILLLLTLWNSFDDNEGYALQKMTTTPPMIFGMRLKVITSNGLSLTTTMGSAIMINPPAAKDLHLDNWYNENEGELEQLLNRKTYNESDLLFPIPQKNDTVPIATAIESLKSVSNYNYKMT